MVIQRSIKRHFGAGLILVAPLVVTLLVLQVVAGWLTTLLNPLVRGTRLATLTANNVVLAQALAVVIIAVLVTVLGWVVQRPAGRRLLGRTGRLVDFIPVVRIIYGSVRQMASSVVDRRSDYESVVYVEFPRQGVYQVGLKTGESPPSMDEVAGERAHNVFLPGSPNPTQGTLILAPDSRVHDADMSVREAIRLLMTTGMTEAEAVVGVDPEDLPVGDESTARPEE